MFVSFADVALRGLHGPLQGLLSQLAPPGSVEHYRILEQFHWCAHVFAYKLCDAASFQLE